MKTDLEMTGDSFRFLIESSHCITAKYLLDILVMLHVTNVIALGAVDVAIAFAIVVATSANCRCCRCC